MMCVCNPVIKRSTDIRDNAGITLVEVLVATSILLIVATMLSVEFSSWLTNSRIAQDRSEAMQQGRLAMAQLTRELRQAISPTASPSAFEQAGPFAVTFRELTGTVTASSAPLRVTFSVDSQRNLVYHSRTVTGRNIRGPLPIASFVSNPTSGPSMTPVFRYFTLTPEGESQELPSSVAGQNLRASELPQIAVIEIHLEMDRDPSTDIGRTIFRDRVLVRTWGRE